jgi:hypothetical protein
MKRLKGGPELKMPEVKVPLFLEELYYDLRDRRLLPLVALAIVAIVAVPFLLSSGSSDSEEAPPPVAGASSAPAPNAADLTVVRAEPGLREYRKRLGHRSPTDPFRAQQSTTDLAGTKLGSAGNSGFESTTTVRSSSTSVSSSGTTRTTKTTKSANGKTTTQTQTETTKPGNPSESQSGSGGAGDLKQGQTLYAYAIDFRYVRTVTDAEGKTESSDPVTRTEVLGAVPLPSEKVPVVTFIGASPSTRKPLFMISSEVTSVFGEGKCLAGTGVCQLMELEVGMPVTFVYGAGGTHYKFTVLKVEPVVTGHS